MNIRWLAPVGIVVALFSNGCDSGEYEDDEVEVRDVTKSVLAQFWDWFPNRAANGDLEVHRGENTEIEECLIFDLVGAGLSARNTGSADDPDEFVLVAEVSDNLIVDGSGSVLCSADQGHFPLTYELSDSNGDVLYTLAGDLVFEGELDVPPVTGGWPEIVEDQLLFHIDGDQVFDRWSHRSDAEVLVTATERIDRANPMRQLVIAALVDGSCGSPGYDSYPDPP